MQSEDLRAVVRKLTDSRIVSATALAEASDISRTHISNFASGRRDLSPTLLERLESSLQPYLKDADSKAQYFKWLRERTQSIDLRFLYEGFPAPEAAAVSISRIFVGIRLKDTLNENDIYNWDRLPWKRPVAHIVGLAGSGKTTLIRKLVETSTAPVSDRLPIFFPLNALNTLLDNPKTSKSNDLLVYICEWYLDLLGVDLASVFTKALTEQTAIVLLDGLDEVRPDRYTRAETLIKNFVTRYSPPLNSRFRLVVTQRQNAPTAHPFRGDADVFRIIDLEDDQRLRLVNNLVRQLSGERATRLEAHVDRLASALHEEPLRRLAGNPLMLTLVTLLSVSRGIDDVLTHPDQPTLLNTYLRAVLGLWNNIRSLDGVPSPVTDNFSVPMSFDVLTDLSRRSLEVDGSISPTVKHLSAWEATEVVATSLRRATNSRVDDSTVTIFINFCVASGILEANLHEASVSFPHSVFPLFLLGHSLRHEPHELHDRLMAIVRTPSPATWSWRDVVVFGLGSMGSITPYFKGLQREITALLNEQPLGSKQARAALPLGHELCLMLQENGAAYGAVTTQIRDELQHFFETTHYALVTHDFQPRLLGLLSAMGSVSTGSRPTEPDAVRAWLEERRTLPNKEWADQVERLWRYQTDAECYALLFDALERLLPDSEDLHEMLYRRLVFGLQFVTKDDRMLRKSLLVNASKKASTNEKSKAVIRAMVSYLVDELITRLQQDLERSEDSGTTSTIMAELTAFEELRRTIPRLSPPDLSRIAIGPTDELRQLIRQLAMRPLRLVMDNEWQKVMQFAKHRRYAPQQILTSLASALQPESNAFERAVALIVLGRMCEEGEGGVLREDSLSESFLPTGHNYELVTRPLLDATIVTDKSQFESVGACQVYDLAVWAMRTMFLRLSSTDGLPLAAH